VRGERYVLAGGIALSVVAVLYIAGVIGGSLVEAAFPVLFVGWAAATWVVEGASIPVILTWALPATILLYAGGLALPSPIGLVAIVAAGILIVSLLFSSRATEWWIAHVGRHVADTGE